jgi:hypothetical protein
MTVPVLYNLAKFVIYFFKDVPSSLTLWNQIYCYVLPPYETEPA